MSQPPIINPVPVPPLPPGLDPTKLLPPNFISAILQAFSNACTLKNAFSNDLPCWPAAGWAEKLVGCKNKSGLGYRESCCADPKENFNELVADCNDWKSGDGYERAVALCENAGFPFGCAENYLTAVRVFRWKVIKQFKDYRAQGVVPAVYFTDKQIEQFADILTKPALDAVKNAGCALRDAIKGFDCAGIPKCTDCDCPCEGGSYRPILTSGTKPDCEDAATRLVERKCYERKPSEPSNAKNAKDCCCPVNCPPCACEDLNENFFPGTGSPPSCPDGEVPKLIKPLPIDTNTTNSIKTGRPCPNDTISDGCWKCVPAPTCTCDIILGPGRPKSQADCPAGTTFNASKSFDTSQYAGKCSATTPSQFITCETCEKNSVDCAAAGNCRPAPTQSGICNSDEDYVTIQDPLNPSITGGCCCKKPCGCGACDQEAYSSKPECSTGYMPTQIDCQLNPMECDVTSVTCWICEPKPDLTCLDFGKSNTSVEANCDPKTQMPKLVTIGPLGPEIPDIPSTQIGSTLQCYECQSMALCPCSNGVYYFADDVPCSANETTSKPLNGVPGTCCCPKTCTCSAYGYNDPGTLACPGGEDFYTLVTITDANCPNSPFSCEKCAGDGHCGCGDFESAASQVCPYCNTPGDCTEFQLTVPASSKVWDTCSNAGETLTCYTCNKDKCSCEWNCPGTTTNPKPSCDPLFYPQTVDCRVPDECGLVGEPDTYFRTCYTGVCKECTCEGITGYAQPPNCDPITQKVVTKRIITPPECPVPFITCSVCEAKTATKKDMPW